MTKFGAWDKLQKKFLWPWPDEFNLFGEVTCFDLIGQQLHEATPELSTLERINDVVIVSFIGLKDKNGKEAYTGAIFKDGKGIIRTIFEVPGGFATESNPVSFGYGYQNNSNPTEALSDKQTASWFEGNCEIIGNIFETPELLDKSKSDFIPCPACSGLEMIDKNKYSCACCHGNGFIQKI